MTLFGGDGGPRVVGGYHPIVGGERGLEITVANQVDAHAGVRPGHKLDIINETVARRVEVDVEVRTRSSSSGGKVLPAGTEVRCRVIDRQALVNLFRRKLFLDIIVWTHGPNTLQLFRRRTVRQAVQDVRNEQVVGAQRHTFQ